MRLFRLSVLLVLCALGTAMSNSVRADGETAAARLHAIFEAEWEWTLENNPTLASTLGDLRYNDRWPDVSLAAIKTRNAHRKAVLKKLDQIDRSALSEADETNYRLFRREYELAVELYPYRWHLLPLTQLDGIQDASSLADALRFQSVDDYEDWIARLHRLPTYMDQTIALMREGIEAGMVYPQVVMKRLPPQIERQIVEDPAESLFYRPLRTFPETIRPGDRQRLAEAAARAVREEVVPAYRRLLAFFQEEYLPACFDKVGIWRMPRGRELYALKARQITTTGLQPEQIHQIGLEEVRRIRGEMDKVLKQVEWPGTFEEFLEHLRTDPKFYVDDADELLKRYRAVCKEIDPGLVRLFGRLPRMPYGVEPVPMHLAPDTPAGYYRRPAADGSRAGTFFVNLYKPESRPLYEIEVLSLHEAVPGHHLQIALAMELENLPAFRRYTGYTAFVEGWALYGERLGEQLGCYRDPYSKFGQLTYEMWRAVRLVVDTGIHHLEWPRQKAIDFFAANAAKTMLDIENEVDRYIVWPGQALAYKIGELKFRELRRRAETRLGQRFDVRRFHEVVLSGGAVTLDVLESNVEAWIAAAEERQNDKVD